jgi:hypothetical protein
MFLRAYAAVASLALVVLATAAFRQARPQNLGEITVERINVVDADGTVRLVISNKERMHPGIMDGVVIDRARPVPGLIFFNEQGDEVGGITYAGHATNNERSASGSLTFDQLKQDQTIGIRYSEHNGERSAALEVWDRSDRPLSELIKRLNEANRIPDAKLREAQVRKARDEAPPAPRRVFVGKNGSRASVTLADAKGQPRLNLIVDGGGDPRIEFLDERGKVVSRLPAK